MSGLPIDPNTEILTRNGWRSYQDYIDGLLKDGEDIYTYESSSKTFKWEPLIGVVLHDSGPMINVNLEATDVNNKAISLIMGEKVPWIVEVIKRESRRITGYDGIKLKEINKIRTGIGEIKKSYDIGTTYYLILGDLDNTVTHQKNDNKVDFSNITVTQSDEGFSWTPYNTNETIVVRQKGLVFCVGTLSLRDGIDTYQIPISNNKSLPIALDNYIEITFGSGVLSTFLGFSPLLNTTINTITLETIPPITEGIIYDQGIPITTVPYTIPITNANKLIFIPDKEFFGLSQLGFKVIDSKGNTSDNTGIVTINISKGVTTETILIDIKDTVAELPLQTFNANVLNLPLDYSKETTLESIKFALDSLTTTTLNTNVLNLPLDCATEISLQTLITDVQTIPNTTFNVNVLSLPITNLTADWRVLTNDTVIPAGSSYIYIYVQQGPVQINGLVKNTGDYVNLEATLTTRHPEITITIPTGKSVELIRGF